MPRPGRKRVGSREQGEARGQGPEKDDVLQAQRREKMRLFIQDFVQQGKQIVADLKKRAQTLVSTTEKAFAVELLKMPTAVRQMKRKDFLSLKGDEEATIAAIMKECLIDDSSIMKVETNNSKRGKGKTTVVEHDEHKGPTTRTMSTNRKLQKLSKTKSGVLSASSRGTKQANTLPRSVYATPATKRYKKTISATAVGLTSEGSIPVFKREFEAPILRSVCSSEKIQSALLNVSQLSVDLTVPLVNIPLADGQTVWSTGDDLETIDVELLHSDTVQHIHNLASRLKALCGKVAANQFHGNTL
ncbi:borealin-2 [Microcaecilia unicolor]|uniref:Borealin-2-like n=1 Tax=Microcaecilia unicolor TaxID=1415580 RepID=A0A6P7YB25_9AMPH|nr:borealin-2-like [Microcaecilia unicolor]